MAVVWIDGFEGYASAINTQVGDTQMVRRYATVTTGNYMQTTTGRWAGFAIKTGAGSEELWTPALTTNATIIVGVAIKFPSGYLGAGIERYLISLYDGATLGMNLRLLNDTFKIYRGATLLATSSALGLSDSTWYYFEFKVLCDGSSGTYEAQLNGAAITGASGSGNTKAGSHNYHNIVKLQAGGFHLPIWDDYYICDGSGSINNTFLGQQRVTAIFPRANGDSNDWTVGQGSSPLVSHYTLVDENPIDDETANAYGNGTFVISANSGARELYYFDPTIISSNISAVQLNLTTRIDDVQSLNMSATVRSGANTVDTNSAITSSSYVDLIKVVETDPATGNAWDKTGLDLAQFGVKVA